MSLYQDLELFFSLNRTRKFAETLIQHASPSISTTPCAADTVETCRDDAAAFRLKFMAIAAVLIAGAAGVALPLAGGKRRLLRTDGGLFVFAKAFAAGVILATGFVHMLHDAQSALTDPCLPDSPWRRFPFSGFVAMMAALGTLVVDFVGTQFYERKHREEEAGVKAAAAAAAMLEDGEGGITIVMVGPDVDDGRDEDPMHIVGMRAHKAAHRHSHPHGQGECDGGRGHEHPRGHTHEEDREVSSHVRHVVVSQILELGIVSHSVIIGLSLGVSQSPCTIRPLIGALSFHQFFEGFALGGCISQAQFKNLSAILMACFFAITTPMGIAVGSGISSFYSSYSPRAHVIEGMLDSVSAGILIYMALVDLIAADFLSQRMSCNLRLPGGLLHCALSWSRVDVGIGNLGLIGSCSNVLPTVLPILKSVYGGVEEWQIQSLLIADKIKLG